MNKTKKAQGMPLNVVIIAVLVLVVLVVLVIIMANKISSTNKETEKIQNQYSVDKCAIPGTGRECVAIGVGCGSREYLGEMDCGASKICCQ